MFFKEADFYVMRKFKQKMDASLFCLGQESIRLAQIAITKHYSGLLKSFKDSVPKVIQN